VLGVRLTRFLPPADQHDWVQGKTSMSEDIIEGPWNEYKHKCPEGKDKDVGFGPPINLCMTGWELLQSKHPGKPCVAYDIGVRDEAGFALHMIDDHGCKVRAYDPSPHTAQWWDNPEWPKGQDQGLLRLKQHADKGEYKLLKEAAGGKDGDLTLYAFNWQQLGTFKASEATSGAQEKFTVPSKTLKSMMQDNGDDFIDLLKVDIEGSEFAFLNAAFDTMGCPPVEHIMMEWHAQDIDTDYGAPPEVKEVETKMYKCGYKKYVHYPFFQDEKPTKELKFDVKRTFYGHAAYCKNCV